MSPDTLYIASTAGALWAGDVDFGSDSTALRMTDALALGAEAGEAGPVLIVVEPPAVGLARRLADADGADPLPWLALWRESARALARFVRVARRRALVIDAVDLSEHPVAIQDLVAQRLGVGLSVTVRSPSRAVLRPIVRSLAATLCSEDADTHDLLSELHACCWPVGVAADGLVGWDVARGASDAARDLEDLLRSASRADDLSREMAVLRAETLTRQQRLSSLQDELAEAVARHQAAQHRAEELERVLAETRMHAQALVAAADAQSEARVAATEAANREQVLALEEALARQREELVQAACALEESQVRAQSQHATLARVLAELERAQQDLAAARTEADRGQAFAAAVEAHAAEIAGLREDLIRCEADREAAKVAADAAKAQAADQQDAFDRLVVALHHAQEEFERTHHQAVAERERAAAQLQTEKTRAQEALAARDEKIAYLRSQSEQVRAELSRVQESMAKTLEERQRDHATSLASLRAQAEKAAADGKIARETVARLEQELKAAREGHAKDRGTREEKIVWLRQQLEKARAEAAGLKQVQDELQRLAACQHSLEAELAAARDDGLAQAAAAQTAREEADELLAHLHEAQAQVEQMHERQRELAQQVEAARATAGAPQATAPLATRRWTIVAERDTLPYRELSVRAARLTVGERSADDCPVRLVEHHGHPGLVLFAPSAQPHPLPSWRETGREGDAPYLRLMPDDPHCRPVFEAMGSTEWLAVLATARDLRDELSAAVPEGLDPTWVAIARRLAEALAEMPLRARADQVDVTVKTQGGGRDALRLSLHHFTCGTRVLPRLELAWRSGGRHAGLTLLADPVTGPVLPVWPTDASGQMADRLTLPIGPDVAAGVKRARWRALPVADRAMLVAVLEALPGWLEGAPQAAEHVAAARSLAADARTSCTVPTAVFRPKAALRRAVRLLGVPAPAAA